MPRPTRSGVPGPSESRSCTIVSRSPRRRLASDAIPAQRSLRARARAARPRKSTDRAPAAKRCRRLCARAGQQLVEDQPERIHVGPDGHRPAANLFRAGVVRRPRASRPSAFAPSSAPVAASSRCRSPAASARRRRPRGCCRASGRDARSSASCAKCDRGRRPGGRARSAADRSSWCSAQYSVIGTPSTSSITKYGTPSLVPPSRSRAIRGCSSAARIWRSCLKRSFSARTVAPPGRHLESHRLVGTRRRRGPPRRRCPCRRAPISRTMR